MYKIYSIIFQRCHQSLLSKIAEKANVNIKNILDVELCLYDTQKASITGLYNEFITARGLDNQMMSFVSIESLLAAIEDDTINNADTISMVVLFDNEEIGSESMQGAASTLLHDILLNLTGQEYFTNAIAKSILYSADMAHGIHPNYTSMYEDLNYPEIHKGLVIKYNANLRYATDIITTHHLQYIAREKNIPLQYFTNRNDMGCGSTIGPMLSANCGIRTVDIGIPQLAMHSIREMCGIDDVTSSITLLKVLFARFSALDTCLVTD